MILIHTGESRNAQLAVEEVYRNYHTSSGQHAIKELAYCGLKFAENLESGDIESCAELSSRNWRAQKQLAPSSSNELLDKMYDYALENGAMGGKICGAGGGGAFIFYSNNIEKLKQTMKSQFPNCFEIDFDFEYQNIKKLNHY